MKTLNLKSIITKPHLLLLGILGTIALALSTAASTACVTIFIEEPEMPASMIE